ncbi:MAG: adenosylmethionine decarboxylase [Acidobacteria bacterium]|nr:adenosylmethionine decarboxylase [Acidobacteriota bacterium]
MLKTLFFEGSEKKFELVVRQGHPSLRQFGAQWKQVVASAGAHVLSVIANDDCDAYLLSESSLFVYDHRVIMITCGQTTLIRAVQHVFSFIKLQDVELFIYERKNEQLPEDQPTDFEADVALLNKLMPGEAYFFGDPDGHHIRLYHMLSTYKPHPRDTTLEILMHGLSPDDSRVFYAQDDVDAATVGQKSGLTSVFDGFETDGFVFEPYGYSLNAIRNDLYYTVHVTPQPHCSYASFETNFYLEGDITNLVDKVLDIFRPEHCLVMLFEREDGSCLLRQCESVSHRVEHSLSCGYRVQFASVRSGLRLSRR